MDYFGFRYYDAVLGKFTTRDPSGYPDGSNNQLYCNNNPINVIDPLGLMQEGGHYYTTYIIARAVGKSHESANKLAFYSQLPDEVHQYEAIHTLDGETPGDKYLSAVMHTAGVKETNKWAQDVQNYLHSLAGIDADVRRDVLRKVIQGSSEESEIGLLLHAFADSYAHSYKEGEFETKRRSPVSKVKGSMRVKNGEKDVLYPTGVGHGMTIVSHGREGSSPDAIGYHYDIYKEYVFDLYKTLGGKGDPLKNEMVQNLLKMAASFNDKYDSGFWFLGKYDYKSEIQDMRDFAIKVSDGKLDKNSYKPEANNQGNEVFDINEKGGDGNYDTLNEKKYK